ncbi:MULTISPECIES: hypothetical protein [Nocardioides]|uniref:hypothetical protein n=1 Tax=Nocardioides TaxID=1839 RepID=UPI00032F3D05|nr:MULTISPECIES: hypothetical protein [Nocardioides]EON23637.1 hypothetical protein CF8_2295 [Nocardioides sp. CF8]
MRSPLALVVAAALLSGCGGDATSDYCETVKEHQVELSDIAASTEPGAIFGVLDAYRDLRDASPRDLRDEWSQVIGRLEALEAALDAAGVDPSTYDPKTTLKSLPAEERSAIQGAARDLGDERVVAAMAGIEQQALDVCKAPLSQ